jgi:hypothetical protein
VSFCYKTVHEVLTWPCDNHVRTLSRGPFWSFEDCQFEVVMVFWRLSFEVATLQTPHDKGGYGITPNNITNVIWRQPDTTILDVDIWMSFNIHLKKNSVVHSDRPDLTYLKSSA